MADAQNAKGDTKKETFLKETTTQTTGLTSEIPIIEFKISINRTSPAPLGDKYISKVLKLDDIMQPDSDPTKPRKYQPWGKEPATELALRLKNKLKNIVIVNEEEKIDKILSSWKGKEPISVIKRSYDNDIVRYADLVKKPLWQVKIKIFTGAIPLTSAPDTSIPPTESRELANNRTPVRIDAFLSFDDSEIYTISPYKKWRKDIKKTIVETIENNEFKKWTEIIKKTITASMENNEFKEWPKTTRKAIIENIKNSEIKNTVIDSIDYKKIEKWPQAVKKTIHKSIGKNKNRKRYECIKYIYQAISKDEKDIINELRNNNVISHSIRRLTVDKIGDGEWLLPIYVYDGEHEDTKKILKYVKVTFDWTSEEAKATDKTDKTDQKALTTASSEKKPSSKA